ncbi:MAG: hypothetical protein LBF83_04905 [Spirochaetaceae bacterium]|jgi:hypothetical protein|nr:hypothetical protein [Spirochaetaceae bacterium]
MIGIQNESSLHRALKNMYAGPGGKTEVETGGYVCDCMDDSGGIVEIQTGSFAPLRKKLAELGRQARVTVVYPVIEEKYIALYDDRDSLVRSRKSPKKGCKWDIFNALVYAPELPLIPGISVELVVVDVLEKRRADGKGSWRRGGVSIVDRLLQNYKRSVPLYDRKDYMQFVPFESDETFTAAALAAVKTGTVPIHLPNGPCWGQHSISVPRDA